MRTLPFLLVSLLLSACVQPHGGPADAPAASDAPANGQAGARQGALSLLPGLDAEAGPARNLFYSPASIEQAFGLVHLGAGGETRTQIEAVLPPPRNPLSLASKGDGVEVRLANALWLSDSYQFRDSYVGAARREYGATAERLDFTKSVAVAARVNAWADKATEGLIPSVLTPTDVTMETRAILTNALYFDGTWAQPFDSAETKPFLFGDGTDRPFYMMREVMTVALVKGGGLVAVRLPYTNPRYAMDVIIPESRVVLPAAPAWDVVDGLGRDLGAATPDLVEVELPRFEIATDMDLGQPLQAIGLTRPFDSSLADFTAMSAPGERGLSIDKVRQLAKLQVFASGTRAAAVTVVRMVVTGARIMPKPPVPFQADRPFMVVLRDLERGEVLFLGRIADPQAFTPAELQQ